MLLKLNIGEYFHDIGVEKVSQDEVSKTYKRNKQIN